MECLQRWLLLSIIFLIQVSSFGAHFAFSETPKIDLIEGRNLKRSDEKQLNDELSAYFDVAGQLSLTQNERAPGQDPGLFMNFGGKSQFTLHFTPGQHEVHNWLSVDALFAITPASTSLVKPRDQAFYEGLYQYYLPMASFTGPYLGWRYDTSLFNGYSTKPTEVTHLITEIDGTQRSETGTSLQLTNALFPMQIRASSGWFVGYYSEAFSVVGMLGPLSFQQTIADGQYVVTDYSAPTKEVSVLAIHNATQLGPSIKVFFAGALFNEVLTYSLRLIAFHPSYVNWHPNKFVPPVIGQTNLEGYLNLGLKLNNYFSLKYGLQVIRQPILFPDFQMQNTLMLNFSYKLL